MKTRTQVWLERLALAGLLTAAGAASTSAATVCVNPAGTGGCFTTIQAAVTAAAAGDTVKVGPGVYFENVVVLGGKDGLQIIGASKATTIVDADDYTPLAISHAGPAFVIVSQFVKVKNLMIRNGKNWGIIQSSGGGGGVFQGLNISGPAAGGILSTDWNTQIIQNEIHNVGIGILAVGFGSVLKTNNVTNCNADGALVAADAVQITGNKFVNTTFGINASGDGLTIKSNDVRHQAAFGILATGSFPTIQLNKVLGSSSIGILTNCTNCFGGSIASNIVTDSILYGILAISDSPGLLVQRNTILRAGLAGITVSSSGGGIFATSNKVTDAGISNVGNCFEAFGPRHTFTSNIAANCTKAGFYVNGDQNTLTANSATSTAENGFTVDGDNSPDPPFADSFLTKNRTTLDAGQGFAILNGAVATTLTTNAASKNRVDFCDAGAGTILIGNLFGTIGTCDISHP